jgi:hypothetical protein
MESLREFIAITTFVLATGLIALSSSLASGSTWLLLIAALICFVASYSIWPSKRRGERKSDNSVLDLIEFIIEFPVELFLWVFRLVARLFGSLFGGKDGGLDIDL